MRTKMQKVIRSLAVMAGLMVALSVVPVTQGQVAADQTATESRSTRARERGFDVGWLGLAGLVGLLGLKRRHDVSAADGVPRHA